MISTTLHLGIPRSRVLSRFLDSLSSSSYSLHSRSSQLYPMPKSVKPKRASGPKNNSHEHSHPQGLKGKEIGLWYASRRGKKNSSSFKCKVISLDITGIDPFRIRETIDQFRVAQSSGNLNAQTSSSCPEKVDIRSQRDSRPLSTPTDEAFGEGNFSEVEELIDSIEDTLDVSTSSFPCDKTANAIIREIDPLSKNPGLDEQLIERLLQQQTSPRYLAMLPGRQRLPVYSWRDEILRAVESNQVVVISGATGCGKTTQIPQFILEDQISRGNGSTTRIVVTQPRRISAISVAERVAEERGEDIGRSIGYQVRLEHRYPRNLYGSIMYCTTGIVLQILQSDKLLQTVSHIVVDEVHEREFLSDFLLALLRRIQTKRPDLRIILMSATLNADRFSSYFGDCPKLDIPGRLYPVETFFLEDVLRMTNFWLPEVAMRDLAKVQNAYMQRRHLDAGLSKGKAKVAARQINSDLNAWIRKQENLSPKAMEILRIVNEDAYPKTDLIVHLIDYILRTTQEGAILVFVPGIGSIKDTIRGLRQLNGQLYGESSQSVRIYPLHSHLATSRQRGLFQVPPVGQRKIVISTNIAETSVTIEDVAYVIDCGRIKVTDYDPTCNTYSLAPVLVSKANAAQRRGRAGRVRPGVCYHLFSNYVFTSVMSEFLPPELLRMRLEDVILRIKLLGLGSVTKFLGDCMDPPSNDAVKRSLHFLYELQTLNLRQSRLVLTPEGQVQSRFSDIDKQLMRRQSKGIAREATKDAQAGLLRPEGYSTMDNLLLGDEEPLNALGKQLATLPLDPQCGKLLLLGAIFSCLEPALVVAACLSYRDPFEIPLEREAQADRKRLELAQNVLSDHWVLVTAMQKFRQIPSIQARRQFCNEYFLRDNIMLELLRLMKDYAQLLYEHNYISSPNILDRAANVNQHNFSIFRAIICGALYPNIIRMSERERGGEPRRPKYLGRPSEGVLAIHPKSVNSLVWPKEPLWMLYFSKTRMENSPRPIIADSTIIPLRTLLFFGGNLKKHQFNDSILTIGDWIEVQVEPKVGTLLKELRDSFDQLLLKKFDQPAITNWDPTAAEGYLLKTICDLLSTEPAPRVQSKSFGSFGPNRSNQDQLHSTNRRWSSASSND